MELPIFSDSIYLFTKITCFLIDGQVLKILYFTHCFAVGFRVRRDGFKGKALLLVSGAQRAGFKFQVSGTNLEHETGESPVKHETGERPMKLETRALPYLDLETGESPMKLETLVQPQLET